MSGKYINRLPRGMPADQTRALSDVFQDLHRDATQYQATANNAVVRPQREKLDEFVSAKDFGAVGDGTADDTTALSNWIAHLKTQTAPKGILPYGDYLISSTLTFDLPNNATIEWNGRIKCGTAITNRAVILGSSSSNTFGMTVCGAGVDVRRTTYDTSGSSIGCEVANLVWAKIRVRYLEGFNIGLYLNGTQSNGGVSHCYFDLGYLHDNKNNLYLTASGSGYCNENTFYGGSFGYTSAWGTAAGNYNNTYNIYENDFTTSPLNNNKFFGPSLEAQSTSTVAAQIYGQYTHLYSPRIEVASGTASSYKINLGAASLNCLIVGGFGVSLANISDSGSKNSYLCDDGWSIQNAAGSTGTAHKVRVVHNSAKGYEVIDTGGASVCSMDGSGIVRSKNLRASANAAGEAGYVTFGVNTQTTVGAAGAASALPANPTGYLRFFVGTTEYVLPYYAQA